MPVTPVPTVPPTSAGRRATASPDDPRVDILSPKDARTLTIDPYALLALMPELTLEITRLPDDEMGRWVPDRKTILLDDRLSQAERRCTLVHEMVHHLNGDNPRLTPELAAMQEKLCHERTARLLIPISALGDAMVWSDHADEIADQLWVDEQTLWDRLENLTPEEQTYITGRVQAAKEGVA